MAIQPYLFFNGRCDEAIDHYQRTLDASVEMLMRYRESPEPPPPGMLPPGSGDKVMHASLRVGDAIVMMSDGHCSGEAKFDGFSLSIAAPDEATARRYFAGLADGGSVRMPLGKTFWSPCFGMVADRFGVGWMVTVEG
jgi:PhnB protein